jgi:hypothetical protein
MLCHPAKVEAELLELDPEGAIDRLSALLLMLMSNSVDPFSRTLVTAAANPGSSGQRSGLGSRGALPAPSCRKSNPLLSMRC